MKEKNIYLIAFLWWFAEWTLFFIIPDIFITFVALFFWFKKWVKTIFFVVIWAMLGGSLMYFLWKYNYLLAYDILTHIPLINKNMINFAQTWLGKNWLYDMIIAPSNGIPYKIYAVLAWKENLNYFLFLLFTIPARASRFILSFLLASLIWKIFQKNIQKYKKYWIYLFIFVWICIYITYYFTVKRLYY